MNGVVKEALARAKEEVLRPSTIRESLLLRPVSDKDPKNSVLRRGKVEKEKVQEERENSLLTR